MKMYYFNPDNYDMEYILMASSPEEALSALLEELKNNKTRSDEYQEWKDATLDNLPASYKLQVFEPLKVLYTEIS